MRTGLLNCNKVFISKKILIFMRKSCNISIILPYQHPTCGVNRRGKAEMPKE